MPRIDPYDPLDLQSLGEALLRELERHRVYDLKDLPRFVGSGIYALYYTGSTDPYGQLGELNRKLACRIPIYVGRSKDAGARQGVAPFEPVVRHVLYSRIREHARSIQSVANLSADDFAVRVLVVMPIWIPLAEAMAIRQYQPLWNSQLQGFGIHAPGSGRKLQKQSQWDLLHPGRAFAKGLAKLTKTSRETLLEQTRNAVRASVDRYSAVEQDIAESKMQLPRQEPPARRSQSVASPRPKRP